jgi:Subtilase family
MLTDLSRTLFASRELFLIAMCAALAACSGGGSGSGSSTPSAQVASIQTLYSAQATNIIKRVVTYYTNGTQMTTDMTGTPVGVPIIGSDHVTVTGTYSFAGLGNVSLTGVVIEPLITSAPVFTAANYPSNWTTGGTITPPSVSGAAGTYIDNTTPYSAGGTASLPFRQATLTPNGATGASAINDPNAYVLAPTKGTYDLRWGTPDTAGPGYVATWYGASGTATSYTYPGAVSIAGRTVSGQSSSSSGMTLGVPVPDVKTAWNQGWTGKGQNILMIDGYPNPNGSTKPASWTQTQFTDWYTHGITTYLLASRYAPGATMYVVDGNELYDQSVHEGVSNNITVYSDKSATHGNLNNSVRSNPGFYYDVVNISLGYNYWEKGITNPTTAQVNAAFADQQTWVNYYVNTINGNYGSFGNSLLDGGPGSVSAYLTDAVITKAAGNDSITTEKDPLSKGLASDTSINPRLLLVGALDSFGQINTTTGHGTATIASYSNTAGSDTTIQSRFLVASGGSPYTDTGVAINGTNVASGVGTSYAAPRVAGYAAIVRQKFPNLTAPKTADILLATARYDTLTCYPNCDKTVYGQGEASLSRALAPVGYLK